ncbi:MAG: nucleotide sugar dehydrogenase [Candidatus Adiutrix sp.]|jgi:UDP-N-acetyl-D-glucosamine dehydrogenase|nr:nucleotide sugar dehydrogenase [Candidatus Adiutrix sp.]
MKISPAEKTFLAKIADKSAVIGVVGLGYVGLPLILSFAEAGFRVLGLDVDQNKVDKLKAGESYIAHFKSARIKAVVDKGLMDATTDFSRAAEPEALIICVPTPLTTYREPDLSFVTGTLDNLLPHLRPGQLLSLESTTYPGTTDEVLRPPIENKGLTLGRDFFLVYSPEREDPANPSFGTRNIPKVLGGSTPACGRAGQALYQTIIDRVVPVSSTRAAELTKLLENIYRAVNIGLVNELKMVADSMDLDIFEVIRAAATKPFGFTPFYPGPGIGGHCIPIDPFYLTWKARAYGLHTRFIELAGEINQSMPQWVVDKLSRALNEEGRPIKGAKVLILGLAYKKNVDDVRESPSVEVMELLSRQGAVISYHDPHVPAFPHMRRVQFNLKSVKLTEKTLAEADAVVLLTDHAAFDHAFIARHARLIIDTRGAFAQAANVVKA